MATILIATLSSGCGETVKPTIADPACIRWEHGNFTPAQEAIIYGPDYPKTINLDFGRVWRSLVEWVARNNANRREHCTQR